MAPSDAQRRGLPSVGCVGARVPPRVGFSRVDAHIGQRAGGTVRGRLGLLSGAPSLRDGTVRLGRTGIGEKEGPRSPIRILPVNEQGQPVGRGHGQYRIGSKNNPRDRLGSKAEWITREIEKRLRESPRVVKRELPRENCETLGSATVNANGRHASQFFDCQRTRGKIRIREHTIGSVRPQHGEGSTKPDEDLVR